jgi:hypothetical protein
MDGGGGLGEKGGGVGRMGKAGRMSLGWNYKGNKRDGNYTPSNGDTNITFPPIRTVNSGAQIHPSDKRYFFISKVMTAAWKRNQKTFNIRIKNYERIQDRKLFLELNLNPKFILSGVNSDVGVI